MESPRSSTKPSTVHGIRRARELGLDHLEMAWVNGVRMSDASADTIAAAARAHDLTLTAHAPYYVNLWDAKEKESRAAVVKGGATIVPAAQIDRASFVAVEKPVWDKFTTTPELKSLVQEIVNAK